MKRCPDCRRDYHDDTLAYCLEDGTALVQGSVQAPVGVSDGPATAILHDTAQPAEASTQAAINATDREHDLPPASGEIVPKPRGFDKRLVVIPFLLAMAAIVGFLGFRYFIGSGSDQINSIAVLPFVNASGDQETDFLSDGLAETLINSFTKIPSLRVTARSTAFRYKGKETEPQMVGKELNVGAILTGKVLLRGDRLSIQVDLIDVSDGAQIWGNRYDGRASEIINVQQNIARDVSEQLKLKLSGAQEQQLTKNYTVNPEAYQLYLKGRFYWNKRGAENLNKAIVEFKAAAEKDPNYALAYVGLADCYVILENYSGTPASETLPLAKTFVTRALAIDDSLPEAHVSLAYIHEQLWEWSAAEPVFKQAISMNPNYPTAHHWYSLYLSDVGRTDDAITEIKRAQELDPVSSIISQNLTVLLMKRKDYKAAIENGRRMIELEPSFANTHTYLGHAYLGQGSNSEAIAAMEKGVELSGRAALNLGELGYGYAVTGNRPGAISIIKELEEKYARKEGVGQYVAAVYAGLGQKDEAFAWLEKDFQARSGQLAKIRWRPAFETLQKDPRFADLIRRMDLPD
jgi:TolB-like protein/Tfp pilus assembly protein PilF